MSTSTTAPPALPPAMTATLLFFVPLKRTITFTSACENQVSLVVLPVDVLLEVDAVGIEDDLVALLV